MSPLAAARGRTLDLVSPIAIDVVRGLSRYPRSLPAYLFYDDEGSRLYEAITALPEYYPTRTEHAILEQHADAIVELAAAGSRDPLRVIELGAGSATKTQILLRAVVRRQASCLYVPTDVSASALAHAAARLRREEPDVDVRPVQGLHAEVFRRIAPIDPCQFVLFLGSSIGNFEDLDAQVMLRDLRRSLRPGAVFLLGTDLRKSSEILLPAYDDAQGVTAAFNKNMLAHINRELDGTFDLRAFRHVALWNEAASRVEMHLESLRDQRVDLRDIGVSITLAAGERIHTESSVKYDLPRVDALLRVSGFSRLHTFTDPQRWFAVHLAVAN